VITRILVLGLVLVSALLLQTVVVPGFAIAGFRPDLVVLTVLAFALVDGAGTGARYGFAAGLAVDLLSGGAQPVGVSALVLLLVGYTVGAIRPYLAGTAVVGEMAVAVVASAAVVLAYGLLALLLEATAAGPVETVWTALATGLYNGLLAPLLFRPLQALSRRVAPSASAAIAVLTGGLR
jgi:rod shape-determining protein MreD